MKGFYNKIVKTFDRWFGVEEEKPQKSISQTKEYKVVEFDDFYQKTKLLFSKGGKQNFSILEYGRHFIQFSAERGGKAFTCELVGNIYKDRKNQLKNRKLKQIAQKGFDFDRSIGNYFTNIEFKSEDEQKAAFMDLYMFFHEIFDISHSAEKKLEITLE
jgi:hypothetical protein